MLKTIVFFEEFHQVSLSPSLSLSLPLSPSLSLSLPLSLPLSLSLSLSPSLPLSLFGAQQLKPENNVKLVLWRLEAY